MDHWHRKEISTSKDLLDNRQPELIKGGKVGFERGRGITASELIEKKGSAK